MEQRKTHMVVLLSGDFVLVQVLSDVRGKWN